MDPSTPADNEAATPEGISDSTPTLCRAKDPNGAPCVKRRAHQYSDSAGPKKAHRTAANEFFYGGIKTPARFYLGTDDPGHISEADRQTWMRL